MARWSGQADVCSVEGCEGRTRSVGMCEKHRRQVLRYGQVNPPRRPSSRRSVPPEERFWSSVAKTPACWLWTRTPDGSGRGNITVDGRLVAAHRYSYEIHYGDPGDFEVRHTCDVPLCIRPDHLILGDHLDNMADMRERGRSARGEKNARSKLTEDAVLAIYGDSRPASAVALEHGISTAQVNRIRSGQRWAWLTSTAEVV